MDNTIETYLRDKANVYMITNEREQYLSDLKVLSLNRIQNTNLDGQSHAKRTSLRAV